MPPKWKYALHSVSYSGSWGQAKLSLEEVLPRARRLGFDGLMLMAKRPHASPLDLDSGARRQLRDLFEENGLRLACLAGYNDFSLGAGRSDIPVMEMQVSYLFDLSLLARDLGAPIIRVFTGYENGEAPHNSLWKTVAAGLKDTARRASDLGITLAVQNHHDLGAHHLSLADLLAEVDEPNCRAAFDAWAPALQGEDLAAAVRRMAPWIAFTTVADYQPRPRYRYRPDLVQFIPEPAAMRMVPMGEGAVDYGAFFKALEEIGYTGWVAFEICAPLLGGGSEENLDLCARGFLDYMRKREGPG